MIANERTHENPVPSIVTVKPEDRRRWQKLLTEAVTRGLSIEPDGELIDGGRHQLRFHVSSYANPGMTYEVVVERWARLGVGVRCGCRAGEFGIGCTHAALALDDARMWPRGLVIARQPGLPEDDERYEFMITDRVRVRGTDRIGVVSGIRVLEGRPAYRVDDPEQREQLGTFFSYELAPAPKAKHTPKVDPTEAMALLTRRRAS